MQQIINTVNQIIQAGQLIGATALVAVVVFMGYAVWWGGRNGMDVAKKLILPIIIGAVLVFGAPALSSWLQSIVS